MITYAEALALLLKDAQPISETETIPLMYSTGRVLAEDVTSTIDVPGWDNSQMDGYAVTAADLAAASETNPVRLQVSERIVAGSTGDAVPAGTCARIFTGAPMPEGVDTVVPQEEVERDGDFAVFRNAPKAGAWVRRRGSDVAAGSVILHRGDRMTPGAIGMTASIGRAYVNVYRKLRVAVFFSGDELVQPGEPLRPGGIYNSNRYMLRSLLQLLGCEATDLGSIPDTLEATKRALEHAAETSDVILTTGGMSVGEEDHIKPAVEQLGRIDLWRVKLKPGKPLAFGAVKDVPFVGLPGNPVSGFVVFLMMARPFLMRRMGLSKVDLSPLKIRADFDWKKADVREEFVRVRRNDEGGLDLYHTQNSQVLSSCAWADGLVDIPAGTTIARGDIVHYYPFAQFFA
ncbi:gephyrin-like molybdotransferase Glp [Sutterella sp.]|uniref:molybdopterin molybdotransferase MoeA n=1 Tax=Sutterella sp. TaxID=1981025 RepID=UPI0026DFE843|nr:gephyrin-like molybdotransferase Glp [Sutterella sp.]MDO5531957.1 molybdopterin molybdotransferase MoeA [Sutterella sp.]